MSNKMNLVKRLSDHLQANPQEKYTARRFYQTGKTNKKFWDMP